MLAIWSSGEDYGRFFVLQKEVCFAMNSMDSDQTRTRSRNAHEALTKHTRSCNAHTNGTRKWFGEIVHGNKADPNHPEGQYGANCVRLKAKLPGISESK